MVCYRASTNYQGECEWTCRRAFIPLIDGRTVIGHPPNPLATPRQFASIPCACAVSVFKDELAFAVALPLGLFLALAGRS
jgi:hypothetical protein